MKKLILGLIAGVALIAGTSINTQACSGTIYICNSQLGQLQKDMERNCLPDAEVTVIVVNGC